MSCKTILVNLDIDTPIESAVHAASDLAERLHATLIGVCAANAEWPVYPVDGGPVVADLYDQERDEIKVTFQTLHAEFDRLTKNSGNVEWREVLDSPTTALAGLSRVADLVIMSAAKGAATRDSVRRAAPSSVVLQAGRPVLVLAHGRDQIPLKKALVAWKDTREARRAVADAVPLLALAEDVTVVTVAKTIEPWTRQSLADVAAFLERHGIKTRVEAIEAVDENAKLTRTIESSEADLVVSGAYGHSRLREWAFGGVTRFLLDKADANRFMSN